MSSKSKLLILFVVLVSGWIRSGQTEVQPLPRWLRPNHLANFGRPEGYVQEVPNDETGLHTLKRRQANNNQIKGPPTYNWVRKGYYFPISVGLSPRWVVLTKTEKPQVSFDKPRIGGVDDYPEEQIWGVEDAKSPNNNIPVLKVDFDKEYFNTLTGISLEPVKPLRPNSKPPPTIFHGSNAKPENSDEIPPMVYPEQSPKASENSSCDSAKIFCCNRGLNIRDLDRCYTQKGCPGPFMENPCLKNGTK
ncbi:uncharacterized protein LOC143918962 [Arctopsyche grandis]|uniref:uncharacterized protein LOC143918962 n=1 Tax=Arctopsyche grandis TaxID=121162 RepID=UPI00406D9048